MYDVIVNTNDCCTSWLQVTKLRPVLSQLNGTFGEVLKLFGNGTQQSGTLGSMSVFRAASILFCQHELLLNQTSEQKQYLDKFRPDEQTSPDSTDNNSAYDNSTSESICCFITLHYLEWPDVHNCYATSHGV